VSAETLNSSTGRADAACCSPVTAAAAYVSLTLCGDGRLIMSADSDIPRAGLSVTVQRDSGPVQVVAAGEIDMSTAGQMRDSLVAAWNEHPSAVVVDLAAVTFMDSSGIAALVEARNRAVEAGGSLTVVNPQPMVRRVLAVTGLLQALTGDD
jgi:anti-sigma B factor antagonist